VQPARFVAGGCSATSTTDIAAGVQGSGIEADERGIYLLTLRFIT
jgi:hypothetical protein